MPTAAQHTYSGAKLEPFLRPDLTEVRHIKLGNSLTLARGTVLGKVTATGRYIAYVDAAADGSGVAKCFLMYDVITDANGDASLGTTAAMSGNEQGVKHETVPAYFGGTFLEVDLVGFDAAAAADLNGSSADGIFRF